MDLMRETAKIKRHQFGEKPSVETLGERFNYMAITTVKNDATTAHVEMVDRPQNVIHIFEYPLRKLEQQ